MAEPPRIAAFLAAAGCQQMHDGTWRGTVLITVDVGPHHEVVQDQRSGKRYRVLPVDDPDPYLIEMIALDPDGGHG